MCNHKQKKTQATKIVTIPADGFHHHHRNAATFQNILLVFMFLNLHSKDFFLGGGGGCDDKNSTAWKNVIWAMFWAVRLYGGLGLC